MKHEFASAVLCLLVALYGCDSIEEAETLLNPSEDISINVSDYRTHDEIMTIVNDALKLLNENPYSRSYQIREIDNSNEIKYVISSSHGRGGNADTLMYIVNFKDEKGFAVISAKKNQDPILAVTESGHYSNKEECDNPGLSLFMDMAENYIANSRGTKRPGDPTQEEYIRRVFVSGDSVLPRISLEWGQRGVYGQYCPNNISGCNNTAAAMAMSYFEYPNHIALQYLGSNIEIGLNWGNIKRHKSGIYDSCCSTDSPHSAIGHLLRELGHRSNSIYNPNETSTYPSNTRKALNDIGYKVGSIRNYSKQCIRKYIDDGIILMSGYNDNGGHTWIVDGYKYIHTTVIDYIKRENEFLEQEVSSYNYDEMYNHFNWGWNGMHNGYFNDGVFSTAAGAFEDNVIFFTTNL